MTPTSDFSGFMISSWALASAAAMAPIDSLDRCMAALGPQEINGYRPRFRPTGVNSMPNGLFGIFRHERLELGFGMLMLQVSFLGSLKHAREFGPSIRRAHVDDPHGLEPDSWRLNTHEARRLATLDRAPELLFRR